VLYAELFNERIDDFIPFFCAGLLVWNPHGELPD
jgi:hypothetical protein